MARLFISHSSANNAAALALRDWLYEQGFKDDVFLDIDPERGLIAGQRWQEALKNAADRCEAVLFVVSPAWLGSKWCLAEFLLAKSLHKRIFGLIVEPVPVAQLPVEMTAEWQLCELVGEDRFRTFRVDVGRTAEQVAFREAGLDALRRGLQRAGLDAKSFPWPPADEPNRAPYRGLRALDAQDAAIFFGRDAAIVRGLDRIRGLTESGLEKILVVLGASGSGKSSFLRAGLWPRLARDDVNFLPLAPIRPEAAVISGPSGLVAALSAAFERFGSKQTPGTIKEALAKGAAGFGALLDELLELARKRLLGLHEAKAEPTIIIPLDQAEELFNADGAAEAATFGEFITSVLTPDGAAPARRVLVLATMRSDRYELLQADPRLAALKQDLFNLPPMAPAEFKSVIEGPARRVVEAGGKLSIDPALTEHLIADAQGADAMPLLGFTLERLYADYGRAGKLTLDEYQKIGGVQGSIVAAVTSALAEPGRAPAIPAAADAQYAALRAAFIPWLARIDPHTGVPARRVAHMDEIPAESRAIVDRLVAARLLLADRRNNVDVVEVAHESLLRRWPTLTGWLEADAHDLRLVEAVEGNAAEWDANQRHESWLDHRAERLSAAEKLAARPDFRRRMGEKGIAYIEACRAREEAERREREAALAREQARLAEIAEAQKHMAAAQARTARLQRTGRFTLAGAGIVVVIGLIGGILLHQRNLSLQTFLEARQRALDYAQVHLVAELGAIERLRGNIDGALRLAAFAMRRDMAFGQNAGAASPAPAHLAAAVSHASWSHMVGSHEEALRFASFSPNGARVVTASRDHTARIWDAESGAEIAVMRGHENALYSVSYSRDGGRVLTSSWDKTARIWDATTGNELVVLKGHTGGIRYAAFSRDGTRVVTASSDRTARVWDAKSGKELLALKGHNGSLHCASFSPDGTRVVTASADWGARVWDAATGKEVFSLRGHESTVWYAVYSPDGTRIATASGDATVRLWDAANGKQIGVLRGHEAFVESVVFSEDGTQILTSSGDKTARLWDARTFEMLSVLRGHEAQVVSAEFSADGRRIVTASEDKTARVWNVVVVKGKGSAIMRGHDEQVFSAEFSHDATRIVTASRDKTARVWDTRSGRELVALRGHDGAVNTAAFNHDSSQVVTASFDKTARVWDAKTGALVATMTGHQGTVWSAAFSPDGKHVVTASADDSTRVWDANTGAELMKLGEHTDEVNFALYNKDGTRIVTASDDKTVRIWDAATGKQVAVLEGHDSGVRAASFSPDGTRIVSASTDSTARLWDVASGAEIFSLRGHGGGMNTAVFGPVLNRIVTTSADRTARIWDATSFKEIISLSGHEKTLWYAAFSPDGKQVVTAAADDTARIWDVRYSAMPAKELLAEACTRLLGSLGTMTRDEMRIAGYPDSAAPIDVCAGDFQQPLQAAVAEAGK